MYNSRDTFSINESGITEMKKQTMVKIIAVRTTDKFREKFTRKAKKLGKTPSGLHREILEAFVEDRLQITPRSTNSN